MFNDSENQVEATGSDVMEALKVKNQNLSLYGGFLLLALTKNLKLLYFNLDQLTMLDPSEVNGLKMTTFDKIYG